MIAEIHTYGSKPDLFGGVEVRMTDLLEGTMGWIEAQLVVKKISGELVGYCIYDLPDVDTYKKNRTNYEYMITKVVAQWWDKESFHRGVTMTGNRCDND